MKTAYSISILIIGLYMILNASEANAANAVHNPHELSFPGAAGPGPFYLPYEDDCSIMPWFKFYLTVPPLGNPPCPSAGEDITVSFCINNQNDNVNILQYLNADPGGTWDPPLALGGNLYVPCIDGEGPFTYTQDNPGCPIEQATITFDWTWDPCGWELEGLCLTGDEGSFTIPAFAGDHPGSTYTVYSNSITIMPMTGSLDESTDFTFTRDSWYCSPGCIDISIEINEDPSCDYYFGEPDYGCGGWELCDLPLCNCVDPPYAGEDASISICDDIAPFDLTGVLGGNPDPGGSWNLPLNSGGNIYDPMLDGSGTFTYTVSAINCPDDAASVTVTALMLIAPVIFGVPASICETFAPIALPTNQSGITGNWSGPGVTNNSFNPSGLNGSFTILFTPQPGQCALPAAFDIQVIPVVTPVISGIPDSLCSASPPIALPVSLDGINGNWSGTGITNNNFNPAGLNGLITITFNPNTGLCANPVMTAIQVIVATTPVLTGVPDTLCQTDPAVNLPMTQYGVSGNWLGPGITNNSFNPAGLSGLIPITFNPDPGQCANTAITAIQVMMVIFPSITNLPDTLCQTNPAINLPTMQNGVTGSWSGSGVVNNSFNPISENGIILLTFTPDSGQCANAVTTGIEVTPLLIPAISGIPNSICESDFPISLPIAQSGITGNWYGPGVVNNNFSPNNLNGIITLIFAPNPDQCADITTMAINVNTAIVPEIMDIPTAFCQSDSSVILATSQSGITGFWSGEGVVSNIFDPSGLNGSITLTFIPDSNQCALIANISVVVQPLIIPSISGIPDTLCQTAAFILLPTMPDGIAGIWSGPGVTADHFIPAGLSGNLMITFSPLSGQCASPVLFDIVVSVPILPAITGIPASFCENSLPFPLLSIQDNFSGSWSGAGVSADTFNAIGLSGLQTFSFVPNPDQCASASFVSVTVNGPPTFYNLAATCDSLAQSYTVSFDITGGVSGSYVINGEPVGGSSFVSSAFDADSFDYLFLLDDLNGCGPVTITGHLNCACATYAGTMNFSNTPLRICEGELISGIHNGDQNLDPDDLLGFVLHDNAGTQLGMIYGIYDSSTFAIPGGVIFGQVYYLSSVAGSNNGIGSIDLTDACLSVSPGVPVIFYSAVQENLITTLCAGESITVNGNLYNELNPTGTEIFPGGSSHGCDSIIYIELSFYPSIVTQIRDTLCPGESLMVNGTIYDQSNPTGIITVLNGSNGGCDSTISINLEFFQNAEYHLLSQLCYGSSVTVNGSIYNESNPMGVEVLSGMSGNGCDSTIYISLQFDSIVTHSITSMLCPGDSVVVNNVTYNKYHPSGIEILDGGSVFGCDSLVKVDLSFFAVSDTTDMELSLCPGEFVVVNGTVYDELHRLGIEILPGASMYGCDSAIRVNLKYFPDNKIELEYTICKGDSVIINGKVYHEQNLIGADTLVGVDIHGCDSIINIKITELTGFAVDAGPDLYLELGQNVTLIAKATAQVMQWLWLPPDYLSCSDCDSPEVILAQHDILYTLEATTSEGCIATDQVKVFVSGKNEIYVPNIFSPNGDGINDVLSVFTTGDIHNIASLKIYSRWGELVNEQHDFLSNDVTKGWDGKMRGEEMNPGVYVWIMEIVQEDGTHKKITGDVTLIK